VAAVPGLSVGVAPVEALPAVAGLGEVVPLLGAGTVRLGEEVFLVGDGEAGVLVAVGVVVGLGLWGSPESDGVGALGVGVMLVGVGVTLGVASAGMPAPEAVVAAHRVTASTIPAPSSIDPVTRSDRGGRLGPDVTFTGAKVAADR
jgi:hypothetical protein